MTNEFLHHLRDTIILLGGGTRLADMAKGAESSTARDVAELRQTNIRLIEATKDKLVNLNALSVKTGILFAALLLPIASQAADVTVKSLKQIDGVWHVWEGSAWRVYADKSAPVPPAPMDLTPTETAMVAGCNAFRLRSGLPALKPAAWLMSRAREHCRWMTGHGMIHSSGIAENIAYGQRSPEAVTATWIASPGHNANMRASHGGYIGVAAATSASGTPYWVQEFGPASGSPHAVEGGILRAPVNMGRKALRLFRRR